MITMTKYKTVFFSVAIFLLITIMMSAYEYFDEMELSYVGRQPTTRPHGDLSIIIKVPARILELYSDSQLYKKYKIAVGQSSTPTPVGEWLVINKSYSSRDVFGTRWMGLNVPWGCYGIHGTNRPWSIGQFASHGCIRLNNQDIEELFEWVPVGTPVKIEGKIGKINRTLRFRSSGQDVVRLQMKLRELGYLQARADGVFGKSTEEAVRQFQIDQGTKPTGIVDKITSKQLGL